MGPRTIQSPSRSSFETFQATFKTTPKPTTMIFSRVLPFFALALSFSIVSVAKPIAETSVLERADGEVGTADVATVLTDLKASTESTLSDEYVCFPMLYLRIRWLIHSADTLMDNNHANSANIVPLMHDLTKSFTTAGDSLKALKGKVSARQLGPSSAEIATLLASIITVSHMIPILISHNG